MRYWELTDAGWLEITEERYREVETARWSSKSLIDWGKQPIVVNEEYAFQRPLLVQLDSRTGVI